MTAFFSDYLKIEALRVEARSWLNTPFRDGTGARAKKGTQTDCVGWIATTLQSVGAIGAVKWPKAYVSRTGGPEMLQLLTQTLASIPRLDRIWDACSRNRLEITEMVWPGDIIVGTAGGRAHHHCVLNLSRALIMHCWDGHVREGNLYDTMLVKHAHSIWRPMTP